MIAWKTALARAKHSKGYHWKDFIDDPEVFKLAKWMMKKSHQDYMKTSIWQTRRNRVLKRDNKTCQDCKCVAFEVHHQSYTNVGKALLEIDDCITLCRRCHQKRHDNFNWGN